MSRPLLLPTGHSRHVARRVISGDHAMPPLRAEDVLRRPANDDRTGLVIGLLALAGLVGGFILLGVGLFMIGRGL